MKKITYILLLLIPLIIYADPIKIEDFLGKFHASYPNITSLKINFIQTKHSPMFLEPIQAGGTFYYQISDNDVPLLRWEYSPPYEGWGLIRENNYYSYTKILNQMEVYSFEQYRHYQELLGALDFSEEKLENLLEERYNLVITKTDKEYRLDIFSEDDSPAFEKIQLYFQKDSLKPLRLEYYEGDDDYVRFRFQDMQVNPQLADNLFEVIVPDGTTIITEKEIERMLH